MLAIARTVASNKTTTINTGITVHASSTCVLPYICAGSPGPELAFSLKFTTAHTSRQKTVTKMMPVTVSTRKESAEIMSAGVDAGAKIFVGLSGGLAGLAHAAAAVQKIRTVSFIILIVTTELAIAHVRPFLVNEVAARLLASRCKMDAQSLVNL